MDRLFCFHVLFLADMFFSLFSIIGLSKDAQRALKKLNLTGNSQEKTFYHIMTSLNFFVSCEILSSPSLA